MTGIQKESEADDVKQVLVQKLNVDFFVLADMGVSLMTYQGSPHFSHVQSGSHLHSPQFESLVHPESSGSHHICLVCGRTFSRRWHLKRHSIIHTGEKPFQCPACDRGFNVKENLKSHMWKCKPAQTNMLLAKELDSAYSGYEDSPKQ